MPPTFEPERFATERPTDVCRACGKPTYPGDIRPGQCGKCWARPQ